MNVPSLVKAQMTRISNSHAQFIQYATEIGLEKGDDGWYFISSEEEIWIKLSSPENEAIVNLTMKRKLNPPATEQYEETTLQFNKVKIGYQNEISKAIEDFVTKLDYMGV